MSEQTIISANELQALVVEAAKDLFSVIHLISIDPDLIKNTYEIIISYRSELPSLAYRTHTLAIEPSHLSNREELRKWIEEQLTKIEMR